MTEAELLRIVSNFDSLPNDGVVPSKVAEVVCGGCIKEQQWRRNPPIPKRQISQRRFGFGVGDIRALIRGEIQPNAAAILLIVGCFLTWAVNAAA
jgi:hypothetical protein